MPAPHPLFLSSGGSLAAAGQAVEKARYAIFSAETGFTCAYGAAGEPCKETLLRKASEPTAHVAGFGLQSEGCGLPTPPKGFSLDRNSIS